jgi:predicted glutamine amidotransferase
MCRWMAYTGSPALLYHLLFSPKHSLIVQSVRSTMGNEVTNGDGFGVGWYGSSTGNNACHTMMINHNMINKNNNNNATTNISNIVMNKPALYRTVEPAWQDRNMHDLAQHIHSSMVLAHVRAASPSLRTIQQTNCHPFRYHQWLWMHNGVIRNFRQIKRDMILRIDPKYFPLIEGTTDSEAFFYLALTFGLEKDPPTAVAKAVGWIVKHSIASGAKYPIQMTVATADGNKLWAFRYSSEGKSRSLFYSASTEALLDAFLDPAIVHQFGDNSRFIVSEPMGDILQLWNPVPESSCLIVDGGTIDIIPFEPIFDDSF